MASRRFHTGPDGQTRVEADAEVEEAVDEMSFSAHILSLNATALMYLGELGADVEVEIDRASAKHIIDTIAMLRTKTDGNLSKHEARLIDALLYELRLKYVQSA